MTCAEGGDDGKTGVGIGCGTTVGGGTIDGRDSIVESLISPGFTALIAVRFTGHKENSEKMEM